MGCGGSEGKITFFFLPPMNEVASRGSWLVHVQASPTSSFEKTILSCARRASPAKELGWQVMCTSSQQRLPCFRTGTCPKRLRALT
mmetsp:Transcript_22627/g.37174  ORF Transcript_22627/g.37174 Transcript_22627/m.37174 type:complete len:86 (-) Transcript_22627:3-260(-)